MPIPTNTTPETAIEITSMPYVSGLMDSSTLPDTTYVPECNSSDNFQTQWWKYTPPAGVTVVGFTYGGEVENDYFPVLSLWTGTPPSLTQLEGRCVFSDFTGYVTLNVTPGVTHYIQMSNDDTPGSVTQCFFNAEIHDDVEAPAGSIVISNDTAGYPLVVVGQADGSILQVIGFPSFEMAEWLPDGTLVVVAETDNESRADTLKFYNSDLTFRADVPGVFTSGIDNSVSPITSNQSDTFWVLVESVTFPATYAVIKKVTSAGVVTTMSDVLIGNTVPQSIAANADGTILYMMQDGNPDTPPCIRRWDLINDVELSNLVTFAPGANVFWDRDCFVLPDGTILAMASGSVFTTNAFAVRYSDTGTLLNTYTYTSHVDPRIRPDPNDPTAFWAFIQPEGNGTGHRIEFNKYRLSDGALLDTVLQTIKQGEDGDAPLYGVSNSCPMLLSPLGITPPEPPVIPIQVKQWRLYRFDMKPRTEERA